MKVLISAYACEPGRGSEPGTGWNIALEMANHHEVWVLTRVRNRPSIEAAEAKNALPNLHFVYHDLPFAYKWEDGHLEWQLYYYLWQIHAYFVARRLHREVCLDVTHHVTFQKYWAPSFLALLPVPFVWGPVGGGESVPKLFQRDFGFRGRAYESLRNLARWLGEHDPFVRLTVQRSAVTLATTEETSARLRKLEARDIQVFPGIGLAREEVEQLGLYTMSDETRVRFISVGRLLQWKGFHLGLRAFAKTRLPNTEYWIVGDGTERKSLEVLARKLGLGHSVRFWGALSREETLAKLGESHVLVHPSLHESGGLVCLEAMAARRPVICLDLGGPATLVTEDAGFKVPAAYPEQVVSELAEAMIALATDHERRVYMGEVGRMRVVEYFDWSAKAALESKWYREARSC